MECAGRGDDSSLSATGSTHWEHFYELHAGLESGLNWTEGGQLHEVTQHEGVVSAIATGKRERERALLLAYLFHNFLTHNMYVKFSKNA